MPSRRLARCANSPDRTEHDRPHVTPACGPTEVRGGASRPHRSPMRLAAPSGPVGPSIAEATAQSRQRDLFIAPASAVAGMATGAPESQGRRIPSLRRVKHRGHQSHRPPPQAEVKPPAALLLIPSTQQGTPHGTTDSCWTHPPCRRCTERPPRRACWRDISAHGGEDHRRGNAGDRRPFPRCSPQKQRGDCYSSKDGNAIELAGRWGRRACRGTGSDRRVHAGAAFPTPRRLPSAHWRAPRLLPRRPCVGARPHLQRAEVRLGHLGGRRRPHQGRHRARAGGRGRRSARLHRPTASTA
jgi:hypothetical protein